jgi:exodeoxyribonuclease VII large subunit
MKRAIERERDRINSLNGRLESHGRALKNTLARGFAIVWGPDGNPVVSAAAVSHGMSLSLEFHDGKVAVTADGAPRRKPRGGKADDDQGSLL